MPRKPKPEKKTVTVVVDGRPFTIVLHPPAGARRSWYAYWGGLVASKSTGRSHIGDAVAAVERMVRSWMSGGEAVRPTPACNVLTDQEFMAIQAAHYGRHHDPEAQGRAAKTLEETEDAVQAFRAIIDMEPLCFRRPVAAATPDVCAAFQRKAVNLPVNWRKQHPNSRAAEEVGLVQASTVRKWSRSLQAAFERANRGAGKKCVRGVVDEAKLLAANPWSQFTWIEGGANRPIRQFDPAELLSFLTYLEEGWPGVRTAALATKVLLWSCCRKLEAAGLKWPSLRTVAGEYHFEVVGKHGVKRWFRVPEPLYRELLAVRTDSPSVFAAYTGEIRMAHADNPGCLRKIRHDFTPDNLGRWIYERVKEWAAASPNGNAYVHVFRKTGLQYAHDGEEEDVSRRVAADAGVSESVLLGHYVVPKLRKKSNRTFHRLLASLPPEVARRYGFAEDARARLERQLEAARESGNWELVARLAAELGRKEHGGPSMVG